MEKINARFRKLKFNLKRDFFTIENIVLIVAIILCLTWTFQSIQAMSKNWELSEKLLERRYALEIARLEVESAELENLYLASEEYQELLARKQLDKKLPGENMVILPENSLYAIEKYKTVPKEPTTKEYSNFEKWMMYLFPNY